MNLVIKVSKTEKDLVENLLWIFGKPENIEIISSSQELIIENDYKKLTLSIDNKN